MIYEALLSAGLLIVFSKLLEGVLRRFRLNAIVAYTAAGIVLGPITGIVNPAGEVRVLLGVGIFLFFFLIGLDELDISGFLAAIRGRCSLAAVVSVVASLLAALVVTFNIGFDFGLGLDFAGSLAVAGVLSLTSLGVLAKVLIDEGKLRSPIGIEMFTTALIAELLVLLVVGFSVGEHAAHPTPSGMLMLLGQIAGFVVVTWLLASRVIPPLIVLLRRLLRVPQLSFGVILGILFLVVVGAEEIGLHGSLGALLFGAALSRLPHQIRRELVPGMRSAADGLFVPLFFSSAGLYLSTSFTALPVWTIAALVAIPAAGKFGGAALGAAVARVERPLVAATGLMAKGIAEIALLLVLRETGLIGADVFSLLVLIMLGYILLMPPIIGRAVQSAETAEPSATVASLPPSLLRFALDNVTVSDVIDPARSHPGPSVPVRTFVEDWVVPPPAGLRGRGRWRTLGNRVAGDASLSAEAVLGRNPPRQRDPRQHAEYLVRRACGRRLAADDGGVPDGAARAGSRNEAVPGRHHQSGDRGAHHLGGPRRGIAGKSGGDPPASAGAVSQPLR